MKKPKIRYNRSAYVETSQEMLDLMEDSLNSWAEGDGNFCICHEDMVEWLEEAKENLELTDEYPTQLVEFMQTVVDGIEGEVGDIVFHN